MGEINQGGCTPGFFLLWIWSHGSGREGYWLCLLVMATGPWGVASRDFSLSGKISGGILQRRCGVSKRINKWASANSYHQTRLRSGRSMRRQKLPFTVWWSLAKDLIDRKEHLSRMALHRPLQPLPGSKYSASLPSFPSVANWHPIHDPKRPRAQKLNAMVLDAPSPGETAWPEG